MPWNQLSDYVCATNASVCCGLLSDRIDDTADDGDVIDGDTDDANDNDGGANDANADDANANDPTVK